jgi:hypothetical protein
MGWYFDAATYAGLGVTVFIVICVILMCRNGGCYNRDQD